METPAAILKHFVSLGDNCEFGFLQRHYGIETGNLLRWAVTPPEALIQMLRSNFRGLFIFDNLVPSSDNMVRDMGTQVGFHTQLRSAQFGDGERQFLDTLEVRMEIYENEVKKIEYLKSKMLADLAAGNKVFVYKFNKGLDDSTVQAIHSEIIRYNKSNSLLIIKEADDDNLVGIVDFIDDGLCVGYIDCFAPYSAADLISLGTWTTIVKNAWEKLNPERLRGQTHYFPLSLAEQILRWSTGVQHEYWFWFRWFETNGLEWQYDFVARQDQSSPLEPYLSNLIGRLGLTEASILDVGAGPITNLGYNHPKCAVFMRACDPLAPLYEALAIKHSIQRPVVTELATVEDLSAFYDYESFDIVNCCNSLDHSFEPLRGIVEILRVVKKGGAVMLRHHKNEAQLENYQGFHQWNFDVRDGRFMISNRDASFDVRDEIPIDVVIECKEVGEDVIVEIIKNGSFSEIEDAPRRKRHAAAIEAMLRFILKDYLNGLPTEIA